MDKMSKLLSFVSKNIPYYINYFNNNDKDPLDINSYPILSKKDYIDNMELMISKTCCIENLKLQKTSGTTGIPLCVYRTPNEYYNQVLELWRIRKTFYKITPFSRKLAFYLDRETTKNLHKGYCMEANNELVVGLYDLLDGDKSRYILDKINAFRPEYIRATPTAICKFISFSIKHDIHECLYIYYIESQSEFLFDFQRDMMTKFFPNAQISNGYGCTEISGIAQEVPNCSGLHVISNNAFIEICDSNNKITQEENVEGDFIITGLNSLTMPFIRYRIGDKGKIITNNCKCNHQIIQLTAGRTNDFIKLANGKEEHCAILVRGIEKVNSLNNQIIKFKFIQKLIDTFEVYLTIKDAYLAENIKDIFLNYIESTVVKDCKWNFHFVDFEDIEQNKSKFCYFESKVT